MLDRILLGLDEGGAADHAVQTILRIAHALDSTVEVLHAVPMEWRHWSDRDKESQEQLRTEALRIARQSRIDHLRTMVDPKTLPDSAVTACFAKPGKALLERADSWPASLVAVGGHTDHGMLHFGSTARTLLAKCSCPVWVQACPTPSIRRILVAVDLSPHSVPVLDTATALARGLDAAVSVLHCFAPPTFAYGEGYTGPSYVIDDLRQAAREDFDEFLHRAHTDGVQLVGAFEEGEPAAAILERAEEVDLIVMGTHGHTSLLRTVLGSQAYRVIKRVERAVLAVPYAKRAYQME